MKFNIQLYLTEAYIYTENYSEAMVALTSTDTSTSEWKTQNSYSNVITDIIEDGKLSSNSVRLINMASLNFLTENIEQAEENLQKALSEIQAHQKLRKEEVPRSMAYSLIYLNLLQGDSETALNIIKKQRIES